MTHQPLIDYLRPRHPSGGPLPADTRTLSLEIQRAQTAGLEGYKGLPTGEALNDALKALAVAGRVEQRGGEWFWVEEPVKPAQQPDLFS